VGSILSEGSVAGSPISGRVWLFAMLICVAAGVFGAVAGWIWTLAPVICLAGLICLMKPDWGLYLLVCSFFFPYSTLANFNLYPADAVLFLIVIGFWLQRLRQGRTGLTRTPVNVAVVVWLAIMALSLVNAYDLQRGIINWLRHLQLILLFYTVLALIDTRLSRRLLNLLISITVVLSVFNILSFVQSDGTERVFGLARITFSGISTLVTTYLTARLCCEDNPTRSRLYIGLLSIAVLGQIANQSRGALIFTVVGMIIAMAMAWRWSHNNREPLIRRRVIQIFAAGAFLTTLAIILAAPLFKTLYDRFMYMGNAATTMHYRYFVWKTALTTYLNHPVLGIGLAQIQVWHHLFPSLRLDPIGSFTFGIGSHNTMLKYLAETGTLGIIAFLWFYAKITQLIIRVFRLPTARREIGHLIGLWSVTLTIIARSFVEGHAFFAIGGITTVMFFGLSVNSSLNAFAEKSREKKNAS